MHIRQIRNKQINEIQGQRNKEHKSHMQKRVKKTEAQKI